MFFYQFLINKYTIHYLKINKYFSYIFIKLHNLLMRITHIIFVKIIMIMYHIMVILNQFQLFVFNLILFFIHINF